MAVFELFWAFEGYQQAQSASSISKLNLRVQETDLHYKMSDMSLFAAELIRFSMCLNLSMLFHLD